LPRAPPRRNAAVARRGHHRTKPVSTSTIAQPATISIIAFPTGPVIDRLWSVLTVSITPPSVVSPSTRASPGSTNIVRLSPSRSMVARQLSRGPGLLVYSTSRAPVWRSIPEMSAAGPRGSRVSTTLQSA